MPIFPHLPPERGARHAAYAGAITLALHVLVIVAALFWLLPSPPPRSLGPQIVPIAVNLDPPRPKPAEKPAILEQAKPAPQPKQALTAPVPDVDVLSDTQLAGAASAGEGAGGGVCDMARLVQDALRRDPMVRSAVEKAGRIGQATLLWNGDWVQSGAEEGKGLSTIREAIMWEVGFAPQACRSKQMHGLVVLSLADKTTRFALGTGTWRWSDLLGLGGR